MYPRNAAAPERIAVGSVYLLADGTIQTADVLVRLMPQGGVAGAGGGTLACDATSGIWYYTPTQIESNFTSFMVFIYKASCTSACATVVTTASSVPGNVQLAAAQPAVTFTSLSVTGQLDAGNLLVDGTTVLTGTVGAGVTTLGGLTVSGAVNFASAVTFASTLQVAGATTLASLSVTGQLDAGNLLVDGTTVLTGTVGTGAVTLASLYVTAGTTLHGAVALDSTLAVTGTITYTGAVLYSSTETHTGNIVQNGAAPLIVDVAQWLSTACHAATVNGVPVVQLHNSAGTGGINAPANFEDLSIVDTTGLVAVASTQKVDVETIKTRAITCDAGVTVLASVGTAATSTAQTGDSFVIVNGDHGLVSIQDDVDALSTTVGVAGAGLTALASATNLATVAGYLDTEIAAILDDTGELQTDWHDGGRLDLLLDGASAPTAAAVADAVCDEVLHTDHEVPGSLSVLIQAAGGAADPLLNAVPGTYAAGTAGYKIGNLTSAGGSGADSVTITWECDGAPIPDGDVWVTSDEAGETVVAGTLHTDSNGHATFLLDSGATYFFWASKDNFNSIRGQRFVAVAD